MTARVNGRRLEALYGTGVVWTIESAALCDCCYKVGTGVGDETKTRKFKNEEEISLCGHFYVYFLL